MMVRALFLTVLWLAGAFIAPAGAAERIVLSLPETSRYAPVAERVRQGAELAAERLREAGRPISLTVLDDRCESEAVSGLIPQIDGAQIVIGGLCFETARAMAKILSERDGDKATPVIALGARNRALQRARSHDGLSLFAIGPEATAEAQAFVDLAIPAFAGKPFAIIDDGSVHGRSLADDIRLLGEKVGIKPIAVANFRPLQSRQTATLRRLMRSGVEALIIAGAPEDIVTISRDMKTLGLEWPVAIGEQAALLSFTKDAQTVPDEWVMIRPAAVPATIAQSISRALAARDIEAEAAHFDGYALLQIAAAANTPVAGSLADQSFNTIFGKVSFGEDGRSRFRPFEALPVGTVRQRDAVRTW